MFLMLKPNTSTENSCTESTQKVGFFSVSNVQFQSSAKLNMHISAPITVRICPEALNISFLMENTFQKIILVLT